MSERTRVGILLGGDLLIDRIPANARACTEMFCDMFSDEYRIDVVTTRSEHLNLPDGVNILSQGTFLHRTRYRNLLHDAMVFHRYVRREKPDVLLTMTNPQLYGVICALLGKRYRIPSVIRNSSSSWEMWGLYRAERRFSTRLKAFLMWRVLPRVAYTFADAVICLGPRAVSHVHCMGVSSSKLVMIPQAVDPRVFFPIKSKSSARGCLGLPVGSSTVLFVGRLDAYKGLSILEDVIREHRDTNTTFVVIGDGPEAARVNAWTKEFPNVIALRSMSSAELARYYRAADALILPSMSEGLPFVALESLACGTPVIATPVGELPYLPVQLCATASDFSESLRGLSRFAVRFDARVHYAQVRRAFAKLIERVVVGRIPPDTGASMEVFSLFEHASSTANLMEPRR